MQGTRDDQYRRVTESMVQQIARELAEHPEVRYGLTTMCIGLGMGGTVIWENTAWQGEPSEGAA